MYSLRVKWFWFIVSLVLIGSVTFLSLLPASELPEFAISDKILHFVAYFVLATWFVGFTKTRWYWLLGFTLLMFSYVIEEIQGMSRWRQFDWYDVLANGAGIMLALILGLLVFKGWSLKFEDKFFSNR